jgi:hypothetical protein
MFQKNQSAPSSGSSSSGETPICVRVEFFCSWTVTKGPLILWIFLERSFFFYAEESDTLLKLNTTHAGMTLTCVF